MNMLERVYASRGSIDKRELTSKAMAGLIGAAIGWIPVELASHGHTLTEHESTPTIIAGFVAMALVSALIGGMIVAAQDNSFEITPAARRRFLRGFVICLVIAI